jgi:C1A family cysteine protease
LEVGERFLKGSNLPDYKNWYAEGKVNKPQNQKNCGSCWAFSAAAVMESLNHLYGNETVLTEYSIQQLLDCDKEQSGCKGGWMWQAFNYTKYHGIATRAGYKKEYLSRQDTCTYTSSMSHFKPKVMGMIEQDRNVNLELKRLV